jgi:hypothetical protein
MQRSGIRGRWLENKLEIIYHPTPCKPGHPSWEKGKFLCCIHYLEFIFNLNHEHFSSFGEEERLLLPIRSSSASQ